MPYGYITKLSDKLTREHVRYNNRYGTAIAADIYYVKDIDKNAFVTVCDSYETRNQDRLLKNVKNVKSI